MPNAVEVSIKVLPDKLGQRLIAYLDLKHPYQRQRDELKRSVMFNALAEFLDREMPVEPQATIATNLEAEMKEEKKV